MFVGEMNLKQWIANSLIRDNAVVEVVDADLLGTKPRPTDEMFVCEMNLKQWIANSLIRDNAVVEVVDADLLGTEP
ncbi:hypothetical protein DVH24_011321 [Malus domestica]|uniref:Uncharacterized protein n=1 Tax=Malus domestica TaxID=3750 RepID=A0A498JV92_MALDO|nr:hypothetical protein DVH24_011321 [Malus domestica]